MTPVHFSFSSAFMLGLIGLTFDRTHLSALLCLEGIILSLFIALSLILLAFSACKAGAGLALLVATTQTHDTDHLQNLNLLQC
ncbi:NU4LM oxidoreductase, partial [Polyodon spathula]|nr:NU4LM oxidoreductase [Polyodon spathula]